MQTDPPVSHESCRRIAKEIGREIAREEIKSCFTKVGINHQNPREFQDDLRHLRTWRLRWKMITDRAIMILIGIIVAGFCAVIWSGFKLEFAGS